jgi:hypothetical protein
MVQLKRQLLLPSADTHQDRKISRRFRTPATKDKPSGPFIRGPVKGGTVSSAPLGVTLFVRNGFALMGAAFVRFHPEALLAGEKVTLMEVLMLAVPGRGRKELRPKIENVLLDYLRLVCVRQRHYCLAWRAGRLGDGAGVEDSIGSMFKEGTTTRPAHMRPGECDLVACDTISKPDQVYRELAVAVAQAERELVRLGPEGSVPEVVDAAQREVTAAREQAVMPHVPFGPTDEGWSDVDVKEAQPGTDSGKMCAARSRRDRAEIAPRSTAGVFTQVPGAQWAVHRAVER